MDRNMPKEIITIIIVIIMIGEKIIRYMIRFGNVKVIQSFFSAEYLID